MMRYLIIIFVMLLLLSCTEQNRPFEKKLELPSQEKTEPEKQEPQKPQAEQSSNRPGIAENMLMAGTAGAAAGAAGAVAHNLTDRAMNYKRKPKPQRTKFFRRKS